MKVVASTFVVLALGKPEEAALLQSRVVQEPAAMDVVGIQGLDAHMRGLLADNWRAGYRQGFDAAVAEAEAEVTFRQVKEVEAEPKFAQVEANDAEPKFAQVE